MAGENELVDFEAVIKATNVNQGTKYTTLKEKQKEALAACFTGDLIGILPTGYGKTVIIHLLPFLQPESPPSSVIVVAPLNAIISEQRERFGSSCLVVDDQLISDLLQKKETDSVKRLKTGDFLYLLGHPEAIAKDVVCELLIKEGLDKKISHVVVDEAHCILSYGKSKFRPAFMKLGCMKIVLPSAKVVALTATATPGAIAEITEVLHMNQPKCVKASPDRPSVYLEVKRRPPGSGGKHDVAFSYDYCTSPLLHELHETEELFPRTIVYLPLKWCGHTHQKAFQMLHDSVNHVGVQPADAVELKSLVAQYHAPQTPEMKSLISSTMLKPNSQLRLLLATQAYGMGADCPNVRRVIHAGPPKNLEAYVQEIGRCARDGQPGRATLYYNNSDVPGCKKKDDKKCDTEDGTEDNTADSTMYETNPDSKTDKNYMTESMRNYCVNTTVCRREKLMEHFGFELVRGGTDVCCDICSGTVEMDYAKSPPDPKPNATVVGVLMQYFDEENEEVKGTKNCTPELHTGLCLALAKKIASYPQRYMEEGALAKDFPYIDEDYIDNIIFLIGFGLS